MNIYVNGYIEGIFKNVDDLLPSFSKNLTDIPYYHDLEKERVSTFKKLVDFLKNEGYFFHGEINAGINITPVANKTINIPNTCSFLLSQSIEVELPDYTYLVSPFLKNKDILQELKKYLELQILTGRCFSAKEDFTNVNPNDVKSYLDTEINDFIQYLLKQEEKRKLTISENIRLMIDYINITITPKNEPLTNNTSSSSDKFTKVFFDGTVGLNFTIPIITQSFEPFKVITLNVKETVIHLGQKTLSMDQILTDPTITSTFETNNDKEKTNIKIIENNDFLGFQI